MAVCGAQGQGVPLDAAQLGSRSRSGLRRNRFNGFATIVLFVLIDPQLSVMTDDVVAGSIDEPMFRRIIVLLTLSRIAGIVLAQVLFVPAAWFVVLVAGAI